MKPRLSDFAHDLHSQAGEDGILQAIFDRSGVRSRVCIEFGAWDGLHLSNTAQFWRNGWPGILIEAASRGSRLCGRALCAVSTTQRSLEIWFLSDEGEMALVVPRERSWRARRRWAAHWCP